MIALAFFTAILGVYFYSTRHQEYYVVLLYLIMTSCFGLLPLGNMGRDLGLLMILYVIFKYNINLRDKTDSIGRIILILLGYYIFRTGLTVVLGEESFFAAIKTLRFELFYLSYFVLKSISVDCLQKSVGILLKITIVFCLAQIVLHLTGGVQFDVGLSDSDFIGFALLAVPTTAFFFSYLLLKKQHKLANLLYLSIVVFALLLVNVRGLFIGIMLATILLIIRKRKVKYLFLGVLFLPLMWGNFASDNKKEDPLLEIANSLNKVQSNDLDSFERGDGTFGFRLVLIYERVQYINKNLKRALFGIGVIQELSPNNNLSFLTGSGNLDPNGNYYRQMIDTQDVSFISHYLRFGAVYLLIYIYVLVKIIKNAIRGNNLYSDVTLFVVSTYLIASLTMDYFSLMEYWMPLLLAIIISEKLEIRKKLLLSENAF